MTQPTRFPKKWGAKTYVILDRLKYERYWIGKRPSSRVCYEEWLNDPEATLHEISKKYGKKDYGIQIHTSALKKLGIMTRIREAQT